MLLQRVDVDGIDPLVGVINIRDDKGLKLRRANIDRDALDILISLPIDGQDFVCSV